MLQDITCTNDTDEQGHPTGGSVTGVGLSVSWQNGPLGRGDERQEPNGTFVETVIEAARQRLEFYQQSQFRCVENSVAETHLAAALAALRQRTERRERSGIEGTHEES